MPRRLEGGLELVAHVFGVVGEDRGMGRCWIFSKSPSGEEIRIGRASSRLTLSYHESQPRSAQP